MLVRTGSAGRRTSVNAPTGRIADCLFFCDTMPVSTRPVLARLPYSPRGGVTGGRDSGDSCGQPGKRQMGAMSGPRREARVRRSAAGEGADTGWNRGSKHRQNTAQKGKTHELAAQRARNCLEKGTAAIDTPPHLISLGLCEATRHCPYRLSHPAEFLPYRAWPIVPAGERVCRRNTRHRQRIFVHGSLVALLGTPTQLTADQARTTHRAALGRHVGQRHYTKGKYNSCYTTTVCLLPAACRLGASSVRLPMTIIITRAFLSCF